MTFEKTGLNCPYCGSALVKNAKFCVGCGKELPIVSKPSMKTCSQCGYQNGVENKFCAKCGNQLNVVPQGNEPNQADKTCPKCGHKNNPDDNFCVICGSKLKGMKKTHDADDKVELLRSKICSLSDGKIRIETIKPDIFSSAEYLIVHSRIRYPINDIIISLQNLCGENLEVTGVNNKFIIKKYASFKNIELFLDESNGNGTVVQYYMESIKNPNATIALSIAFSAALKREAKKLMNDLLKELEKSRF